MSHSLWKALLITNIIVLVCGVFPALASDNSLNWDSAIGLSVVVENSSNCNGSNSKAQTVTNYASLTGEDNGCPIKLAITVTGAVETQNAPYDYVYVNDVLFFSGNEDHAGCPMTTKTVTKTITVNPSEGIMLTYDTTDGLYHVGAYATITNIELVEEGCSSGCEAGGSKMENGSIHVSLNLGRTDFGQSVGALRISESLPSAVLGTPASLRYSSAWNNVDVIRDTLDAIRQVKTPQCLADVVTETATRFHVDFYDPTNIGNLTDSLYDQTDKTYYVRWIIENLDHINNGYLRITQVKGVSSVVSEFIWDAVGQGWQLIEGNSQRKDIKTTVTDAASQTRTVTTLVKNAADQVVSKEVNTYKDFAWGRELIQTIIDPDGAALTHTRAYYEDSVNDGGAYGKMKQEIRSDGSWARYEYAADGRKSKTVEPFLDAPITAAENLCKVTTLNYQETAPQEARIVSLLGQEIERSYKFNSNDTQHITRDIICTVPGVNYDAPTNLVTETKLVSSGEFAGETQWIKNPDGSGQRYQYSKTATEKTTIVESGVMSGQTVISGTRTTTITGITGNLLAETTVDIASGLTLSLQTVTAHDNFGRPTTIDYNDGTTETIQYGCCGVDSRTDREGITTSYTYDAFKRILTETRAGITTVHTYDAEGRSLTIKRIGSDDSEILQQTNTYDLSGRIIGTSDALNFPTTYAYTFDASGRPVETITHADGCTEISVRHKDGRAYTLSGTATAPRTWMYGVEIGEGFYTQEIRVGIEDSETEWIKTWLDHAGRSVKTQQAGQTPASSHYNNLGQLVKSIDPDGVTTLFEYDPANSTTSRILDLDRDGARSVTDPTEITKGQVLSAHDTVCRRSENRVINASGVEELVSQSDTSADGRSQWNTSMGLSSSNIVTYPAAGSRSEITTRPDNSTTARTYTQGRLTTETTQANGGAPCSHAVTYTYEPHGRILSIEDARNGVTSYTHDVMDRVLSVTTPVPAPGLAAQNTIYVYDSMGRITTTTLPDSSQTTREYFLTGKLKKSSGSQTPTVEYTYDPQGRMITMLTTGQAGPATTTWHYDAATGWLQQKIYPGGDDLDYTYTQAGRPLTRTSGRGITRTHLYDDGGRTTGINYTDGTPSVAYTLNSLGQITNITDASGTRTRDVTTDGRLLSETITAGLLNGTSVSHAYDTLLRPLTLTATSPGNATFEVGYTYDDLSRLQNVTSGLDASSYIYQSNSGLIESVTSSRNGTASLTTSTAHDNLERLSSTSATTSTGIVSSHAYTYNTLNQRTESVLENGSKWNYQYDVMGQVTEGNQKQMDNTPIAGAQFGYAYDGIGNRTSATVNGRVSTYNIEVSNQYTQRDVPGMLDIRGSADPAAKVTVNHQPTQRFLDYFYKGLAVANGSSAQFPEIKVTAVKNHVGPNDEDLQSETIGHLFLAKNPEEFTHDADGNLTTNGRWAYTWDGENRLIQQETHANIPDAAKRKLEYTYDSHNRRVRKQVFNWDGSAWVLQKDLRFLYDRWNLIAELDATNTMTRNYVWGLDLSLTTQGAGGVGGLLSIREGTESHHPAYDGNGNIMALIKASDLSTSARYQYGPFGETLVVHETGVSNPFRFSTKYHDAETGLYYYGFRYYDPVTGRWKSMDPIGERGGVNLYGFVGNEPIKKIDKLGKLTFKPKWAGKPEKGPTYNNMHLWIAGWLWPEGSKATDSGYIIERFHVKKIMLKKCNGDNVNSAFRGSDNNLWTLSPFGPNYFDPFRNSTGVKGIYTVFVNTEYGRNGQEKIEECSKGDVEIFWTFRYYSRDPNELTGLYNNPIEMGDAMQDTTGKGNEKNHKLHSDVSPPEGNSDKLEQSGSFSMRVWWDWCGNGNKNKVHHSPDWDIIDRPNRN